MILVPCVIIILVTMMVLQSWAYAPSALQMDPVVARKSTCIHNMPSFTPEEEAALEEMIRISRQNRKATSTSGVKSPTEKSTDLRSVSVLDKDWRSAMDSPYRPRQGRNKIPIVPDMEELPDLTYEDVEKAMRMEEFGGKYQEVTEVDEDGLLTGDVVSASAWSQLVDSSEKPFTYRMIHKDMSDILVFFADPRRLNADFQTVLKELERIPRSSLDIATVAITCADPNDVRKMLKKAARVTPVLIDTTRKLMEELRCRGDDRIMSALGILDVKTGQVIRIWYEKDWDPSCTKDAILEELKEYRRNPKRYMERNKGIREE